MHRERSSKQCDDGTQVRPRASSELDGLKKLFIFLPSALFIIALNRRVEKKGMEKAKRNRVYVPLCPFVDFQPRTGFLSLLSLSLAPASFSLSLSLFSPSLPFFIRHPSSSPSPRALPTHVSTLHHGEWVW